MDKEYILKCNVCGLTWKPFEAMYAGYECCNPDSIEHIE